MERNIYDFKIKTRQIQKTIGEFRLGYIPKTLILNLFTKILVCTIVSSITKTIVDNFNVKRLLKY